METEEEAENPVPNINDGQIPNIDENQMPNIDQVPNIDEGDEGNPLAVVEYIQDISRLYREIEVNISSFKFWLYRISCNGNLCIGCHVFSTHSNFEMSVVLSA